MGGPNCPNEYSQLEVVCAGRGAAATATGNSGRVANSRVGRRGAGAPAQPTAVARGARSGCLRSRHRQSLLPLFCVWKLVVWFASLESGRGEKRSQLPRGSRKTKISSRGGVESRGRRATRTGQTEGAKREGAATTSPERQERCAQLPSSTVGRLQPNGEQEQHHHGQKTNNPISARRPERHI
jgi:hypothetical protein